MKDHTILVNIPFKFNHKNYKNNFNNTQNQVKTNQTKPNQTKTQKLPTYVCMYIYKAAQRLSS